MFWITQRSTLELSSVIVSVQVICYMNSFSYQHQQSKCNRYWTEQFSIYAAVVLLNVFDQNLVDMKTNMPDWLTFTQNIQNSFDRYNIRTDGSFHDGKLFPLPTDKPVILILADHFEVPSKTDWLTAFMWPAWFFSSTPKTSLYWADEIGRTEYK